jgi:hypothetical protein
MAKPSKQKTRLQESDWAALFPSKSYMIGTSTIDIAPLSIQELSLVLNKLVQISDKISDSLNDSESVDPIDMELDESLISKNNAKTSLNVLNLVKIVMEESPDILSDISGIDVEDVKALPLDIALDLFNFCLDVNIESQDSLIKNFNGLGDRLSKFTGTKPASSQTRIPLAN